MDPLLVATTVAAVALAIALLLLLVVRLLVRRLRRMGDEMARLRSQKQSQATRHGQTLEQFAPLLADWPWDPKGFRFLGSPIDGVQFNDDGVVFVEIKSGLSTLNPTQRRIRQQLEAGQVRWVEVRL